MKTGFYTILFFTSASTRKKQITLTLSFIKFIKTFLLIILAAYFMSLFDYLLLKEKERDLNKLNELARAQKAQVQLFAEKVSDMEADLARLKSLDLHPDISIKRHEKAPPVRDASRKPEGKGEAQNPISPSAGNNMVDDMMEKVSLLDMEAKVKEARLHEIFSYLQSSKMRLAAIPCSWPVNGYVSSNFGERESPFKMGNIEFHKGVDIVAPIGTPVIATADGKVIKAGGSPDYGLMVAIDHGYGLISRYGHLSAIAVHSGQKVSAGGTIGNIGSTGRSTGPHLHYEVMVNGMKADPVKYLGKRGSL